MHTQTHMHTHTQTHAHTQGEMELPFARLHADFPLALMDATVLLPDHDSRTT